MATVLESTLISSGGTQSLLAVDTRGENDTIPGALVWSQPDKSWQVRACAQQRVHI